MYSTTAAAACLPALLAYRPDRVLNLDVQGCCYPLCLQRYLQHSTITLISSWVEHVRSCNAVEHFHVHDVLMLCLLAVLYSSLAIPGTPSNSRSFKHQRLAQRLNGIKRRWRLTILYYSTITNPSALPTPEHRRVCRNISSSQASPSLHYQVAVRPVLHLHCPDRRHSHAAKAWDTTGLTTRIHRSFFSLSPSLLYHTPPVLCCLVPSDFQWCSSPTFSPNSCQLSTPTLLACRRTSAILCANRRRQKQVRVSASEPTAV